MLILTHNDLDALGSEVILHEVFGPQIDRVFYTNYGDLDLIGDNIIEYQKVVGDDTLFIADVSFTNHRHVLEKLCLNFKNVVHCDHHQAPDDFWNGLPCKVIYEVGDCASKILFKKFENVLKPLPYFENLKNLIDLINVYDVWVQEDPRFMESQDLNEYFWEVTQAHHGIKNRENIFILAESLKKNNYNLPQDYNIVVQKLQEQQKAYEDKIKRENLLYRFNGKFNCTVILSWEGFNRIMISEMKNGQEVVVGIHNGLFKVRIDKNSRLTAEQKLKLRGDLTGNPHHGHDLAFTYQTKADTSEDVIANVKKFLEILNSL